MASSDLIEAFVFDYWHNVTIAFVFWNRVWYLCTRFLHAHHVLALLLNGKEVCNCLTVILSFQFSVLMTFRSHDDHDL